MAAQHVSDYNAEDRLVMERLAYIVPVERRTKRTYGDVYILGNLENGDWDKIDHYENLLQRHMAGVMRYQGVPINYRYEGPFVA
ncbi:MAG TPA: hypothetical protein DCY37_00110 [Acidaminococcaceae bacterium]|nr:hypothetical protein [Acidaminococcaceae bacterium]